MGVIRHRFFRVGPRLPCDLGKSRVAQPVLASHASYDTDSAGASVGKHAVACQGVVRLRDEGYFVGSAEDRGGLGQVWLSWLSVSNPERGGALHMRVLNQHRQPGGAQSLCPFPWPFP